MKIIIKSIIVLITLIFIYNVSGTAKGGKKYMEKSKDNENNKIHNKETKNNIVIHFS